LKLKYALGTLECAYFSFDIVFLERPIQRQPFLVQYKQQASPLSSMNNHTPLVICGNDKNKQITLLSQRKLALTAGNTIFAL
jgi:hypothetical protein